MTIADDHPVVLHGLASLLSAEPDFEIVAICEDGAAALDAARTYVPDIAILDLKMPNLSGLEVLTRINGDGLSTKVVFLTATASDPEVLAAITRSAHGVLLKEAAADALVECLRTVASGGRWVSPEVIEAALRSENSVVSRGFSSNLEKLSSREREIVNLVAEGQSNKEIALRLNVTEGTVKVHLHNVYAKIGVTNRTSLAALALRLRHNPGSGQEL